MIVSTMSNEEVVKELLSDVDIVTRKAEYTADGLRRALMKTKDFPFIKAYDYVTPKTKNKWIYIVDIKSKKHEIFVMPVNYHYTNIGLRAALVTENKEVVFYTGHFFSRYIEREGIDILSPVDKMKDFFLNNPIINYTRGSKLEEGVYEIIGAVKTGVVLGLSMGWNLMICNTYLSNEMLKGDQTLIARELKNELDHFMAIRDARIIKPY